MKSQTLRNVISLSVLAIFLSTMIVVAQDDKKASTAPKANPDGSYSTSEYNEADRPEDSYLAKFHARDVVQKLIAKNLEQIYLIKVISSNFSSKGWGDTYKKVYAGYKKALDFYYKRNIIYSRVELENNKKQIADLLKSISDDYQKDTKLMLEECAEKILERNLDATTKSDPDKYRELRKNEMRLHIAYGQYDDAWDAGVDKKYDVSIYHYRVAKTYGIKILQALSDDPKQVAEKYKSVRADNLNRIFEKSEAAKPAEKK